MLAELEILRATTSTQTPTDEQFHDWINAVPTEMSHQLQLSIRIVDEPEARRFNREYRNRDYATNVLSFPADLPEGLPAQVRRSQLGDLLICAPVVVREARQRKRSETDHWAHLTVHGVLHLLGYDHELEAEALDMESKEIEILKTLGISDPYLEKT